MTALLYALTVLIWGTTWIAITLQVGPVAFEASIVYRFALAGAVLLCALGLTGRLQPIPWRQQPFVLLQALCLFSCNFACFYLAACSVPSGIVSVVFSAATVFAIANAYLFHRRRPSARVLAGVLIGLAGIACLFRDTLAGTALDRDTAVGLGLALLGTWFFSAGNLVSARNQRHGLAVATVNAYGMLYGAALVGTVALVRGVPFGFDPSPAYVGSLLYLAVPGSVIGFTAYLTVVQRIGPEKAAYMTVLFPVVALTISVFAEGYRVTPLAALGVAAVLAGNVVVFAPLRTWRRPDKDRPEAACDA
ncbi:DMT family transporter [Methylobacterium oryzisoli]|uniref:DMT family transporter n=1 Tax=Methylobacterium oryzisoli TaxID=3385502 RepID=UPI003892127C